MFLAFTDAIRAKGRQAARGTQSEQEAGQFCQSRKHARLLKKEMESNGLGTEAENCGYMKSLILDLWIQGDACICILLETSVKHLCSPTVDNDLIPKVKFL